MTISILVLKEEAPASELYRKLKETGTQLVKFQLVEPENKNPSQSTQINGTDSSKNDSNESDLIQKTNISQVKLLNPTITRKERQRAMSLWLMPFGLIAGITFAGMTNLDTFSKLNLGPLGETFFGGVLGMFSGWIGSNFAAASVNTYQIDIDALRKKHNQGLWLLILETPFEQAPPWNLIQDCNPIEVVTLNEL